MTGCILFTRLTYPNDDRVVLMLSPVAVATDQQGKGVGQNLITFGLEHLKSEGVDIVTTYGDPNYYSKLGYEPVSLDLVPPPVQPNYPEGWLARSFTDKKLSKLQGPCICIEAFNDPSVW
ncbi:MAG: N-acetyltransferase [Pseudomonadota bacterium]